MQGFPKIIATRQDIENLLADDAYRAQALMYLQLLLDEQYGYDATGAWTLVGGGGLARLGLTRAEAVALGTEDRVVAEPTFDLAAYKAQATSRLELERDSRIYATFTDSDGVTWLVTGKDRDLISQKLLLTITGLEKGNFPWTDATGALHTMTVDGFKALCVALSAWTGSMFASGAVAAGAVNVATTRAEVDAAVAGVVWPAG